MALIVQRYLWPEGVLTVWDNGDIGLMPYKFDPSMAGVGGCTGRYVEIFPNDPATWRENQ